MGVIEWNQSLAIGIQVSGMVLMISGVMYFVKEKHKWWVKGVVGLFMVVFGTLLLYYWGVNGS